MKFRRCFLFVAGTFGFLAANAQFKKGDHMAGSSIASAIYNSGSSEVSFPQGQTTGYDGKSTNYSVRIEPSFGWFISDNTAIGASVNLNPTGQKLTYESNGTTFQKDKSNNFNIGVGAFIRNYFGKGSSFVPFGQFGFNVGIATGTTEGFRYTSGSPASKNSYSGKSNGGAFANASLQLGMTKMMGENVGLDIYLGYNYSYSKNTFKTTTLVDLNIDGSIDATATNEPTTKYSNHGVIVGVGFQIFLKKKK